MRQIRQVVYVLLYLQFFVRDVFTLDVDVLSEKYMGGTNDITGYQWINNWKCESDDECTVTGSTCKEHECQCAPGYIYNSNMTSCVRVATGIHDSCEESVQCSAYLLSGGVCVNNICVCGLGYYYLHGRCNRYVALHGKCEENADCYVNADFEASTCNTEKICECSPGFYQREHRTCRREAKDVGDECTIDIDCNFDENATCKNFVCITNPEETIELRTDIVSTAAASTDEHMMPLEIRVGSNCTSNEDCSELGNAICDFTGTCRCARTYFAPNTTDTCIPELGESCRDDDVAIIEKSICRAGIWSCTNGTVVSADNRKCRQATTEYAGECHQIEDCYIFGPDAKCENGMCVCNTNLSHYVESELFCWINKGIGETCKEKHDCYIEGFKSELECKNGKCGCPDDTHVNRKKTACINTTAGLEDTCDVNEDCVTENAICGEESGLCECRETYFPSGNLQKCLAGFNATCEVDEQCEHLSNSKCTSEVCSCKKNYVFAAIDTCLPILPYGASCLQNVQCSIIVPGAICVKQNAKNKTCACGEEDHYRFGKCYKKKMLTETCSNLGDCYLSSKQDRVICRNGKCMCNWGYVEWNNTICSKDERIRYSPNDGVIKVLSAGLFSVVLFLGSCNIF